MRFLFASLFTFLVSISFCFARVHRDDVKSSAADSYLFPTNASRQINSGFADYRSSHFHGGIDISTNGKIGYPVFAAKSGYVFRISVSPFGYGKMIILRHEDSTFTLYGHLSGFSREIQLAVDSAQREADKYGVELKLNPGQITIIRGEVIAYTGATGVGGPHLHFEIRDRDFSYVDPLVFGTLDVPDYKTPRIFSVAVRGFFSGGAKVSTVVRSGHSYRTRQTFRMTEPFYFVLHGADSYGTRKFKRPPKYIALQVDGKDFINLNLTRFKADDYLDVASLVDRGLSRRQKTYYDLCVNRAIPFSIFTPDTSLSGLIGENFPNGVHSYKISIEDEDGNQASVEGKFMLEILHSSTKNSDKHLQISIAPFKERVIKPSPALTIVFPEDCFDKDIDVNVQVLSPTRIQIDSRRMKVRKKVELTWKVSDPTLRLYRRLKKRWSFIGCENDGKFLTAKIGYLSGEFALMHDNTPPTVQKIRVSRQNPFYRSVAPKDFRNVFVYFRVADQQSGINTDRILLKVGSQEYFCEYDVDKHAAICQVDTSELRKATKVLAFVSDNAGNERRIETRNKFR